MDASAKTVLIVEDNELNMKLFHDLLDAHGYRILQTKDGMEALDIAREHRPEQMWQEESWYRRVGSDAAYRLARFDDRFNEWKLGTTWVVKARKLGGPAR